VNPAIAVLPVRRLFKVVNGGTPTADAEYWDGDVAWATPVDLGAANGGVLVSTERMLTETGLLTGSRAVPERSLLISTRAPIGYVAETSTRTAFNQGCRGLVPIKPLEPRFFRYQLSALSDQLTAQGQGSTFLELSGDALANFQVVVPPFAIQKGVADYLDRETARIDALIAAKRRMVQLLEERWQGFLEATIQGLVQTFGGVRVKYVCRELVVGIVVTPSAWYAESGIPAIRGTNVSAGAIGLDDLVYLTAEGHAIHPKSQLRSGDVVVVRTGQAGAAAVVPPGLEGANCIDLVIIRPLPSYSPYFMEYVLNSDWMQKHVAEHSVGTIQSHFNVGAASVVPVPWAPRETQEKVVSNLKKERRRVAGAIDLLKRQIALLHERRRALVTAAVAGQLAVAEAA
jgi:type I restriction enzyme, S subunit